MIRVILYNNKLLCGFEISGHSTSNADDFDGKLVCSAVSSAAIMTANTITEILSDNSDIQCSDGYLKVLVQNKEKAQVVLKGFELHIQELCTQYPDRIKVTVEVAP